MSKNNKDLQWTDPSGSVVQIGSSSVDLPTKSSNNRHRRKRRTKEDDNSASDDDSDEPRPKRRKQQHKGGFASAAAALSTGREDGDVEMSDEAEGGDDDDEYPMFQSVAGRLYDHYGASSIAKLPAIGMDRDLTTLEEQYAIPTATGLTTDAPRVLQILKDDKNRAKVSTGQLKALFKILGDHLSAKDIERLHTALGEEDQNKRDAVVREIQRKWAEIDTRYGPEWRNKVIRLQATIKSHPKMIFASHIQGNCGYRAIEYMNRSGIDLFLDDLKLAIEDKGKILNRLEKYRSITKVTKDAADAEEAKLNKRLDEFNEELFPNPGLDVDTVIEEIELYDSKFGADATAKKAKMAAIAKLHDGLVVDGDLRRSVFKGDIPWDRKADYANAENITSERLTAYRTELNKLLMLPSVKLEGLLQHSMQILAKGSMAFEKDAEKKTLLAITGEIRNLVKKMFDRIQLKEDFVLTKPEIKEDKDFPLILLNPFTPGTLFKSDVTAVTQGNQDGLSQKTFDESVRFAADIYNTIADMSGIWSHLQLYIDAKEPGREYASYVASKGRTDRRLRNSTIITKLVTNLSTGATFRDLIDFLYEDIVATATPVLDLDDKTSKKLLAIKKTLNSLESFITEYKLHFHVDLRLVLLFVLLQYEFLRVVLLAMLEAIGLPIRVHAEEADESYKRALKEHEDAQKDHRTEILSTGELSWAMLPQNSGMIEFDFEVSSAISRAWDFIRQYGPRGLLDGMTANEVIMSKEDEMVSFQLYLAKVTATQITAPRIGSNYTADAISGNQIQRMMIKKKECMEQAKRLKRKIMRDGKPGITMGY